MSLRRLSTDYTAQVNALSSNTRGARMAAAGALVAGLVLGAPAGDAPDPAALLRVMSYNIRHDNPGDGVNRWVHRRGDVARLIGEIHAVDLAGLQEALHPQILDLAAALPAYDWVGVGRDDGACRGEFSPIFFRRARLELLAHDTFWLSPTPQAPGSRGWDAALPRICTWARFRNRRTGVIFVALNAHFDHLGEKARLESARLIRRRLADLAGEAPVMLMGDLNTFEHSPPHDLLSGRIEDDGECSPLRDTRNLAEQENRGPAGTFTRGNWTQPWEHGPIDFIFVSPAFRVMRHVVLDDRRENGHFPSDHLPVLVEVDARP